ncbi:alpha/beta hydrolase [Yinghuangia soli]|uniref:Alpha/beta-hydrolase family protein n=1 Tax=Yinghuangia soli TaxID=2908204 RepID=A0AA41PXT5_9ACTN|nr:alpha/beta-hydrolase family protein [Yinghuangia soli]MCF2527824.1 alpha/beta-hydrolase family protein [Yinghuangia soli]
MSEPGSPPSATEAPDAAVQVGGPAPRFRRGAALRGAVAGGARTVGRKLAAWARHPYRDPVDPARLVRRWPDLTACCLAVLFFWASLTPSLLPRPWYFQGLVGGITGAIGYALGASASGAVRLATKRRPSSVWRTRLWQGFYVLAIPVTFAGVVWSAEAQERLRELQSLPPSAPWNGPLIVLIAVVVAGTLVVLGRAVRLLTRRVIRWLRRLLPRPVAYALGVAVCGLLLSFAVFDVVWERGVIGLADQASRKINSTLDRGVRQPVSPLVSGSPESLVRWDELGAEGRKFISAVPDAAEISAFTGRPALDPIRVYIGEEPAREDFPGMAELAVRELDRTGGFDRQVVALLGTTGSGWIDRGIPKPLEYMYGGDTAMAALQYSYLPSWMSFLVDRGRAERASQALFDAVSARIAALPPDRRPKLVVAGESLGAYATDHAFDSVDALLTRTDGALFIGPPNASPLWRHIVADREPGSPVWRPVYEQGRNIRFAQFPETDLAVPPGPWESPRVVYLQNASDPVVWWNPGLLFEEPAILKPPFGPDITDEVDWFPLVTFWQTTVDLAVSFGAPPPHGHRYGQNATLGWGAVLPPEGWTEVDSLRLKAHFESAK